MKPESSGSQHESSSWRDKGAANGRWERSEKTQSAALRIHGAGMSWQEKASASGKRLRARPSGTRLGDTLQLGPWWRLRTGCWCGDLALFLQIFSRCGINRMALVWSAVVRPRVPSLSPSRGLSSLDLKRVPKEQGANKVEEVYGTRTDTTDCLTRGNYVRGRRRRKGRKMKSCTSGTSSPP